MTTQVKWSRAARFAGWYGRAGRLAAPVFTIEYRPLDDDGTAHEWLLRSSLPGYASARWSAPAPPSLAVQPPEYLQTVANEVLRTFVAKLLGQPVDCDAVTLGEPYRGSGSMTGRLRLDEPSFTELNR